jgi:phage/plasmid-like protein (TIGR03299 family)
MSHEFDSGMFTAQKAWHGLGTVVDKAPTTSEAIALAGMDWTVNEQPLITCSEDGEPELIEGWKCLKRSDNNKTLHVCRDTYTPFQNVDAFKFFDPLLQDGDATLDAAVSLREGKRIAITAKIKDGIADVLPGDPVESYLVLFNAHDGSLALGIMFSNVRVVCANTLGFALNEQRVRGTYAKFGAGDDVAIANKMVRLRHTANIKENLAVVQSAVNLSKRQFDLTIESYKAMAGTKMTTDLFRQYLTNVFATDLNVGTKEEKKIEDYTHYDRLMSNFDHGIGMDIKGVQGTVWAGFQAVTEFATHQRGGDDIEGARNRLNQLWFGTGAQIVDRAQVEAIALCK